MKQLFNMRQEIDIIDEQIRTLLIKRMEIVLAIGEYKKQHQLPILNEKREMEIINNIKQDLKHSPFLNSYLEIFQTILKVSKDMQK